MLFLMGEERAEELVNGSGDTLKTLIYEGGIRIQTLGDRGEMLFKGYDRLLSKLGLRSGVGGTGCG